jgi:hypothetical protein
MKLIPAFLFLLFSLNGYTQLLVTKNNFTYFVEKSCRITSNNPDCFIDKIPFEIRTNQKDTIKYCFDFDTCYRFYKGKCDTLCSLDTTELYFPSRNYYKSDTLYELENVVMFSKAMKDFKEANIWASNDNSTNYIRLTILKSKSPPIIYRLEKKDTLFLTKKISNGSWYFGNDSLISAITVEVNPKIWDKIFSIYNSTLFDENKSYHVWGPDVLLEIKTKDFYKFVYFNEGMFDLTKPERREYRRLIKTLTTN